jgi:hypothetical protein
VSARLRAAVIAALDAIEVGDAFEASAILRSVVSEFDAPDGPKLRCTRCGVRFDWPGLLENHLRNVHVIDGAGA